MTSLVVRAMEPSDLPHLSELTESVFGVRRDVSLLSWLLVNPRCPEQIDSWIAERNGEVVGHTAVLRSRYRIGSRRFTGAHAFLWMVDSRYRGDAGVALGCKIIGYDDDFLVVLGGSPTTKAILAGRRFDQVTQAREFMLARRPTGIRNGFDLVRRRFVGDADSAAAPEPDKILVPDSIIFNEAPRPQLEWLADCPELEAHLCELKSDGEVIGPVLLFVNRRSSPVCGRVVHMPFLGDDSRKWLESLEMLTEEFQRLGCAHWSVLATHPALVEACETAGGQLTGTRPVWIRARQRDMGVALDSIAWHLTYLEGDLAYRRVQTS